MWFIVAVVSFFLLAIAAVTDKFLLAKTTLVPVSFAFLVGLLGAAASSVLIIFEKNFYFPQEHLFILITGGAGFYFALYFMYLAVVKQEVSRINPLINSLAPIFIYLLALLLAVEELSWLKLVGAAVTISGGYLLSQVGLVRTRLSKSVIIYLILAALMFGLTNTFSKMAYQEIFFITAFVWLRWFTFLTAILFVTVSGAWPVLLKLKKTSQPVVKSSPAPYGAGLDKPKNPWPALVVGQFSGGVAVILFQYAISLGSVTIVSSLQGLQYIFLLLMTLFLSKKFPQILKEVISPLVVKKKFFYCLLLTIGVVLVLI